LLEAAALHHQPSLSSSREFTALTAVHVANVLEQESLSAADRVAASGLDMDYLKELGLADRIDVWKECLRTGTLPPVQEVRPKPSDPKPAVVSSRPAFPSPPSPPRSEKIRARQTTPSKGSLRWAALGTAAVVLVGLGWFCGKRWRSDAPIRVRASETRPADHIASSPDAPDAHAPARSTNTSETMTSLPEPEVFNPSWEPQSNDFPLNPFAFFDDPVEVSTNSLPVDLIRR
jgi:hypothetical protein